MTAPATNPADTATTTGEMFHWVCECDWDLALCGIDVGGERVGLPNDDDVICAVCDDLLHVPCPRCGVI